MNKLEQPNQKKEKRSILSSNPVMRRLESVDEYSADNAATYGGIMGKTIYFLLFSIVGIFAQLITESFISGGAKVDFNYKGFTVSMYQTELFVLLGVAVAGIVFQIIAFFARRTTPVTGTLYCITQGYFISFLVFKVLGAYNMQYLGALALLITMLIIVIMLVLYSTGVIRVTKKFKTVMMTLFITMIATSLFSFIGYFIPFTHDMVVAMRNNFALSVGVGVVFIIIAALFLICDFDTIDHVVKNKLPKKYEWQAAFGLAFTVIWLYLKVLDIIITIAGHNNK